MNPPTISLLHASYGRPEKAVATMRLWAERATNPAEIEYVFSINKEDTATDEHLDQVLSEGNLPWFEETAIAVRGNFAGSAAAWDAAYRVSGGSLLVQVSDDFVPPQDWDTALLNRLPQGWESGKLVIAVNDGLRRDRLMTIAICTRTYADFRGEFIHKGYISVFSDNEFTARAYDGDKSGECRVIEARDLLFEHMHHCKTGETEDATYARQNRPEAYEQGKRLFAERNPDAGAGVWV